MRHSLNNISSKTLLFLLSLIIAVGAHSQGNKYPLVRTAQNVTVNRKLPKNILTPDEPVTATFSKEPTDEEIFRVHFFEEPLVPMNGAVSSHENMELIHALAGFSQRKSPDDFSPVSLFLKNNPQSRWRGALLANLGIIYRRTGYYNKALEAWEEAWSLLKNQKEHKIKVLADRVVSELLMINSWVGRQKRMESLLGEINNRVMEGPAVERVSSMQSALSIMHSRPGVSFKCGPYALNKILTIHDSTQTYNDSLMAVQSTSKGFSLTELAHLAKAVHLDYQMAFRNPGAAVILNAVIHWKLDHYSALFTSENGQFKCQDATMGTFYGQEFWLTPAALDSSASGYFLVPNKPLPPGWRKVTESEGNKVFGRGQEVPDPGKHVTPDDPQEPKCNAKPMAQSNVHLLAVSLHIFDQPVYYTPPVGPQMVFNVDYHQRDSYQPANFSYSNLGPKWTFNWLSYVQDNPNNSSANADIYVMGGGARTFVLFNSATQSYAPELQTNDVLVRVCPNCYELRHPDGSKEVYAQPDGNTSSGRKIFLTQKVDPAGNVFTIMYDVNLRIIALKDAIGQVTTLTYAQTSDSYKITRVTDPFGRSANFGYDASGRLNKITDMIGIISSFQYDAATGDFINKMTTPYGSTGFVKQEGNGSGVARALETRYPLGEKERVEYLEGAPGINMSEPLVPAGMNLLNTYLVYRNTFYWDKKAMKVAPGDYTKAKIYHWLHGAGSLNESGTAAPVLESMKLPLENRVWYFNQGQTSAIIANQGMSANPSQTGQVMDDSTTRLSVVYYNKLGRDTATVDPLGRKMTYIYDTTNIDLLEIRQTTKNANDLLAKFTYNSQHLPLTAIGPSGLITSYTYNNRGQPVTIKNPKNEITTLTYNSNGYLQNVTGPTNAVTSFTYDGFGRIRTVTDPEGYKVTTDYDVLDRPTVVTFPDSSFEQIVYDKLDAIHVRDRMSRWSHTIYDSLARPTVLQDPLGRVTQFIWCSCGSLAEIVDPMKKITTFNLDLQGRMTAKTYSDGQGIAYKYENTTSRLKEVTDAKGQKTRFSYFNDDNLKQIDYTNALIATPSVSFIYDSAYSRMTRMTDGTGVTTYAYNSVSSGLGSWRLAAIDGPLANDVISYGYDSLDRVITRAINGVASHTVFDAIGRVTSQSNSLGSFTYNYVNQTKRFSSIILPNGQSTAFDYFDNHGDQLVKEIWNKTPGNTTLSRFDYEYNKEAQITKWTQQAEAATPSYYALGYDRADQLISATQKNQSTSAITKRYAYQYDKAGNRTSEQIDNVATSSIYNNLNQLTIQQNTGTMRFKGSVNKFSSVLVKNQTTADSAFATVDSTNTFETFVKVAPGTNNIAVTATDYSGNNNQTTTNYNIAVTAATNDTLTYDNNGNTRSTAAPHVSYDWDAANRLVKITTSGAVTEFVYDGLNRLVAEKLNGSVTKRWVWCGMQLCEERNASGTTVTKRFFSQGEAINGTKYFFTFDHLGSVREMTDVSGNVQARYDYDPYGRKTRVAGSLDADFGFSGFYFNTANKLNFSLWRVYNPNSGRWLNRDPMEYAELLPEGPNIYSYVGNNPVNWRDKLGLYVKGTPVPIGPDDNSIICKGGKLTVQNNNTGPGKECTQAHESNHINDWIGRYGPNLCDGVPDGQLPVGGPGYDDFLKKSECEAYKVGKKCRQNKLKTCNKDDKQTLEDEIKRDDAQIAKVCD